MDNYSNNSSIENEQPKKNRTGIYLLLCVIVAVLVFFLLPNKAGTISRDKTAELYTIEGLAQGSYYRVSYFDNSSGKKLPSSAEIQCKVDSILKDFDLCASLWVDSSLICKVNRNEDLELNSMFIDIFNKSMEISAFTNGAFDITVGNLVKAYGFAKDKGQHDVFPQSKVNELLQGVGYKKVSIKDKRLVKVSDKIQIDFNAIAQGYCADIVSEYLYSLGLRSYLVDVGGEMCVRGLKNNNEPWNIAIEKPADSAQSEREIYKTLPLTDCAIVTSGNYRKYFEVDGKRYSHTIDPITGRPAMDSLLSATVICDKAWRADAMATAFMVMGFEKTKSFLKQHPSKFKVFLIYSKHSSEFGIWESAE